MISTAELVETELRHAFLDVATQLADKLCETAVWDGNQCSWNGLKPVVVNGTTRHMIRPLGIDFYTGSAGCLYFLSILSQVVPLASYQAVIRGAAKHSITRMDEIGTDLRCSFYSGWGGIAYALYEASQALADEVLREQSLQMLKTLAKRSPAKWSCDVLIGFSGLIGPLIHLYRRSGAAWLMRYAMRLGEELIARARKTDAGWSWVPDGPLNHLHRDHLTGYAHGASGIAAALMELYSVTKEDRYVHGAGQAFQYEDGWLIEKMGNWLDLRYMAGPDGDTNDGKTCQIQWCHGAAGIGLTRLRAYEVTGDSQFCSAANVALQTVCNDLDAFPDNWQPNFSLCHGVAGNCDLLLEGTRVLEEPRWRQQAERMGRLGIEKYAVPGISWPSSLGASEIPGLMTGFAGTGFFYLRLYENSVMPVTLVSADRAFSGNEK